MTRPTAMAPDASTSPAGQWQPIETAPKDGTLLDAMFDPATAERDASGSMADFYAPGCTRRKDPTPPVIYRVEFSNGHFRPVMECGTRLHACDMAVTLTHWRHHAEVSHVG